MQQSEAKGHYALPESLELDQALAASDSLNQKLQEAREANGQLWPTILSKLRTDWTCHSNAIEGSTLSRGDTHFFLTEGLTVEGKPFKDFVDARNHAEAIDFLHQVVSDQRQITESLLKEVNALLLAGVKYTEAINAQGQRIQKPAHPGQYKKQPNHVIQADGSIHWYVEPLQVPAQMQTLVQWLSEKGDQYHPIVTAGLIHYNLVRIHAFDDGNGRGARILMNLVLMQRGFFPAVIRNEKKRFYLNALQAADQGNIIPSIKFVADEMNETQRRVITDLQSKSGE